jgi:hypothetical protein
MDFLEMRAYPASSAGCGKIAIHRHSREGGNPEGTEKTGFLLPQE